MASRSSPIISSISDRPWLSITATPSFDSGTALVTAKSLVKADVEVDKWLVPQVIEGMVRPL